MTRHTHRQMAAAASLVAGALTAPGLAQADDGITTKFSGFGTFGMVRNIDQNGAYRSASTQYSGTGADPDFGVDSRGGVQADVRFNDMFSATGQLLSVRRGTEDFQPEVEWLFGQAKFANGLSLRVGRMGVPAYMVSDFRNVGYATPWIRPPVEVYAGMMYHHFDGAQIVYRKSLGDYNLTVQPSYGSSEAQVRSQVALPGLGNVDGNINLDASKLWGLNVLMERGDWTVRWGTVRSDAKANVDTFTAFPFPFPGWPRLATGSPFKDNFTGYGVQYDNGKLLVMAEYVTRRSAPIDIDGHYLSTAYRLGDWAPYVTVASYKETYKPNSPTVRSDSQTLGLRWNAAKNLSLKSQVDWVDPSKVAFITPPTDKARIFSLALDFVF